MSEQPPLHSPARLVSGVAGLDSLLQGGFLQGSLYAVVGLPGSGKTILGNQIAFHHISQGGRVVYVTLLVEAHHRMLLHLRPFNFFDPAAVTDQLYYVSGYQLLEQEGLRGLHQLLRKTVQDHGATLLIVDGLETAEAYADSQLEFKRFLHELHIAMESVSCTTFVLSINVDPHPAHAIVDGLLLLTEELYGSRAVREIEIRKFRGSFHLPGRHRAMITPDGYTFFPRLESLPLPALGAPIASEAKSFGIARLDEMLHGGVRTASTTLLLGTPGAGKTSLGLHFLAQGALQGEAGLYFGFNESPEHLIRKSAQLGLMLEQLIEAEQLHLVWHPSLDGRVDELAGILLDTIRERGIQRLYIDSYGGFQQAISYPSRLVPFFNALIHRLQAQGVTTLVSWTLGQLFGPLDVPRDNGFMDVVDNMILLRYVEWRSQLHRFISILKGREQGYDTSIREFTITEQGIELADTFESAETILTGLARPHPFTPPPLAPSTSA